MVPWNEVPCSMAQSKLIEIPYVLYYTDFLAIGSLKKGTICVVITLIPMSYTNVVVLVPKNSTFFCCNANVMPTVPAYTRREV